MDADLEMIIKDRAILLPPGHIKAYSIMMLQVNNIRFMSRWMDSLIEC